MQFLRNLIEKQRQLYHAKDSRFHKLWPLFDAFETFLFAPDHRTGPSRVHVRDYVDLKRVMNTVIIAMLRRSFIRSRIHGSPRGEPAPLMARTPPTNSG